MCGFAGILTGGNKCSLRETVEVMGATLIPRGPDDKGLWVNENHGIAIAHRRLSIIDKSSAGKQPMVSKSGRFIIAFNGEIYNHLELRQELLQSEWCGHSDTETLLASIEQWGLEQALKRCAGMFSIALWDRHTRYLHLARDRVGEKPLYYGWQGNTFLFGSELKALRKHPCFSSNIDHSVLGLYLKHNYVPAPYSIYEGIKKLMPGTVLTISLEDKYQEPKDFWSFFEVANSGLTNPYSGSVDEALQELTSIMKSTVRRQMSSDVPLGAFLSGGIDSSTIVALMQSQSTAKVKTFSVGFEDSNFNEAKSAKLVAEHLGTEHFEHFVTAGEALDIIPMLSQIYCEPFSDSSQIPTFIISRFAREKVTVSLSGDGGDELFGGYNRYVQGRKYWPIIQAYPKVMRLFLSKLIKGIRPNYWKKFSKVLPSGSLIGDRLYKLAEVLDKNDFEEFYMSLVSHCSDPVKEVIGATSLKTSLNWNHPLLVNCGPIEKMMVLDSIMYLPDDILVKIDRAAMANSLETRVPFLDPEVIRFSWTLPSEFKFKDGNGKWLLRQLLYKYVPKNLVERPKAGFRVPLANWLREPLRDWAESLLSERQLKNDGFFNHQTIRQKWHEHLIGKYNWENQLWGVLMFQAWLEEEKLR